MSQPLKSHLSMEIFKPCVLFFSSCSRRKISVLIFLQNDYDVEFCLPCDNSVYAFLDKKLHSRLVFVNLFYLALKTRLEVHLSLNFIS